MGAVFTVNRIMQVRLGTCKADRMFCGMSRVTVLYSLEKRFWSPDQSIQAFCIEVFWQVRKA